MEQIALDSSEVRTRIRLQQTPTKYNINPWVILKSIYFITCAYMFVYVCLWGYMHKCRYAAVDEGPIEAIRSLGAGVEPAFVSSLT